MKIIAQVFGILAVVAFLLSFQFKKRKSIIAVSITSRIFYICQYVLLGAFEGASLDCMGVFSSLLARYKDKPFISKHGMLIPVLTNLVLIGVGLLLYKNVFSLFAICGIVLEITAMWLSKEKHIRWVSLIAAPFWMAYNLANCAYGSAVGNVFTILSIAVAIVRYDIIKCRREASAKKGKVRLGRG